MTTGKKLSFGIKTPQQRTTYEDMLRIWREADRIPSIEHAWLLDHLMPMSGNCTDPCLEGWTLLSAFAAVIKRLRLGLTVSSNTYRHPAVLAKLAVTVDIISGGRLDFGIGTGIGAGNHEIEHRAYGIPLYAPGERIRRLGEACEVIQRMWTEPAPNFAGTYYQITDAYCEPKPMQKPYPPFVIGGDGEKLLRVVAQYATIWNFTGGGVDLFQQKNAILESHCAAIGRDPHTIQRSTQVRVNPADLGEARGPRLCWRMTLSVKNGCFNEDHLFGFELACAGNSVSQTPHSLLSVIRQQSRVRARGRLHSYAQAGMTHLILSLQAPYPEGIVHRLDEEIIRPLKAAFEE